MLQTWKSDILGDSGGILQQESLSGKLTRQRARLVTGAVPPLQHRGKGGPRNLVIRSVFEICRSWGQDPVPEFEKNRWGLLVLEAYGRDLSIAFDICGNGPESDVTFSV